MSDHRSNFDSALLVFINETLPKLDRKQRNWPPIEHDTPLFAGGLLDSMSILHLIAFIEQTTGLMVPDELVVMKHFKTPRAIVETFGVGTGGSTR